MTKSYSVTNHSHPYYVLKTEITGAQRGPVQNGEVPGEAARHTGARWRRPCVAGFADKG
jgi:hypothetical protein